MTSSVGGPWHSQSWLTIILWQLPTTMWSSIRSESIFFLFWLPFGWKIVSQVRKANWQPCVPWGVALIILCCMSNPQFQLQTPFWALESKQSTGEYAEITPIVRDEQANRGRICILSRFASITNGRICLGNYNWLLWPRQSSIMANSSFYILNKCSLVTMLIVMAGNQLLRRLVGFSRKLHFKCDFSKMAIFDIRPFVPDATKCRAYWILIFTFLWPI